MGKRGRPKGSKNKKVKVAKKVAKKTAPPVNENEGESLSI
jgi:hypothetical protein